MEQWLGKWMGSHQHAQPATAESGAE